MVRVAELEFEEKERARRSKCMGLAALDSDSDDEGRLSRIPGGSGRNPFAHDDESLINKNIDRASKLLLALNTHSLALSADSLAQRDADFKVKFVTLLSSSVGLCQVGVF